MATIRELITGSLRLLNVVQANETPSNDDMEIAMHAMNSMLDSWSTDKLSIYVLKQYYFPTVVNQKNYTLGPGGDWNLERPMEILQATVSYGGFLTFNNITGLYELTQSPGVLDVPMESLTDAQYAAIPVKDQPATYPVKFYDNGNFPLRTISLWPVPTTVQPITLWLWQPLAIYENLDAQLAFPRGYERAIRFNLAVEISAEFGKIVPQEVFKIASESYANLKRLNKTTPILRNDLGVLSAHPGMYNWNIGTTIPN